MQQRARGEKQTGGVDQLEQAAGDPRWLVRDRSPLHGRGGAWPAWADGGAWLRLGALRRVALDARSSAPLYLAQDLECGC